MLNLTARGNSVLLPVKIVPGSSQTRYLGEWDGRARIAVAAPAEKGRANAALIAWLVRKLSVRKTDVTILTGYASAQKTVRIAGVDVPTVRAALEAV